MQKLVIKIIILTLLSTNLFAQSSSKEGCFFKKVFKKKPDKICCMKDLNNQTIEHTKGNFSIDVDQDFFLDWLYSDIENRDRNYTQGTAFSYTKYNLDESVLFLPLNSFERLHYLSKKLPSHIIKLPATIAMGVAAFTPRKIADSLNPVIGDRPFANVVFLSTTKNAFNTKTKMTTSTTFSYGLIGSNIGNVFQSYAHVGGARPTDIGWRYQISNGGHPAFMFTHTAMRRVFPRENKIKETYHFDGSLGYRVNLGWYTGISGIATFKLGKLSKYSGSFDMRNALSIVHEKFMLDKSENFKINKEQAVTCETFWNWYFYLTLSPRLTPYNSLVLGQPHVRSVYTLPYENYNPFILDGEFGLFISRITANSNIAIPLKNYDLILSANGRTSEIVPKDATQENKFQRNHFWGRITLRFPLF